MSIEQLHGPLMRVMRGWAWEVHKCPIWEIDVDDRPSDAELLKWAASQSDETLFRMRNVGRKTIAKIRAIYPPPPTPVCGECGRAL